VGLSVTVPRPLVVKSLDEVDPAEGGWVYVLGDEHPLYVASNGRWVPYEKPPEPDLWSHLTADEEG